MDPIIDLTVQSLDGAGPNPVLGWEFSPIDLNSGVGGKFIYVGWRRGSANPITTIGFGTFNDSQQDNPFPGYEWNANDLNRGAGGQFIYMRWKREPGFTPLYQLIFVVTPASSPPPIAGYHSIAVDLNAGAGGPYIWAYASYLPQSLEGLAPLKQRIARSPDGPPVSRAQVQAADAFESK